jgi:hypothetical protein
MRHFGFAVAVLTMATLAGAAASAAEIEVPPRRAPEIISIQQGPPNCSRWTDDCLNCSREGKDAPPVCSNIGVACQPKAVRCLGPDAPAK